MSVEFVGEKIFHELEVSQESIRYIHERDVFLHALRATKSRLTTTTPLTVIDNTRDFERLADAWEADTQHFSSTTQLVLHPNYQRIIGMGPAILPLLFARLRHRPHQWFWALRAITGQDPVRPENVGNLEAMANDWMAWARGHGLAW